MYQRLYVPVDDSYTSHRALDEAAKLAKESGGMVRLVHVVDLAQFGWGGSEFLDANELQNNIREAGHKVLQEAADRLQAAGVQHDQQLLESWGEKISEVLLQDAENWQADLIVMGTHGWGELMQLLWALWPKVCYAKPTYRCCCYAAKIAKTAAPQPSPRSRVGEKSWIPVPVSPIGLTQSDDLVLLEGIN